MSALQIRKLRIVIYFSKKGTLKMLKIVYLIHHEYLRLLEIDVLSFDKYFSMFSFSLFI